MIKLLVKPKLQLILMSLERVHCAAKLSITKVLHYTSSLIKTY